MVLGFGLEQGPHEVRRGWPVSPSFSLHSVRAGSLILRNCFFFKEHCFTLDTSEVQTKDLLIKS